MGRAMMGINKQYKLQQKAERDACAQDGTCPYLQQPDNFGPLPCVNSKYNPLLCVGGKYSPLPCVDSMYTNIVSMVFHVSPTMDG